MLTRTLTKSIFSILLVALVISAGVVFGAEEEKEIPMLPSVSINGMSPVFLGDQFQVGVRMDNIQAALGIHMVYVRVAYTTGLLTYKGAIGTLPIGWIGRTMPRGDYIDVLVYSPTRQTLPGPAFNLVYLIFEATDTGTAEIKPAFGAVATKRGLWALSDLNGCTVEIQKEPIPPEPPVPPEPEPIPTPEPIPIP